MPHLHIEYTGNLEAQAGMDALCQSLSLTMAALRDAEGREVFPLAGSRVLAFPAPHHAVAGAQAGQGFIYLNLRITPGRSAETVQAAGQALLDTVTRHFAATPVDAQVGITLHIDEGRPVFEGRHRLP